MAKLISICHQNLKNSKICQAYLQYRNISPESIKKYQIGFFPQNISILKEHVSERFLQDTLIANINNYSNFSKYYFLVFPIFDEYKNPLAIMGRTLLKEKDRKALSLSKYYNSSFSKAKTLYGLETCRSNIMKNNDVYVVEGNFDVISMDSAGIQNVVGICGAQFSKYHLVKLARYTDKITFLLDNDDAGKMSMERIYKKFSNRGLKLRFYHLPPGVKDVDEYFKKHSGTKQTFIKDIEAYIPSL